MNRERTIRKERDMMTSKRVKIQTAVFTAVPIVFSFTAVFAAGDWGQNASEWIKAQVWWIALALIAIVSVKFIAKKMWVQLGGFLVLSAIILVIVDGPERLKTVGETIWNIVFK